MKKEKSLVDSILDDIETGLIAMFVWGVLLIIGVVVYIAVVLWDFDLPWVFDLQIPAVLVLGVLTILLVLEGVMILLSPDPERLRMDYLDRLVEKLGRKYSWEFSKEDPELVKLVPANREREPIFLRREFRKRTSVLALLGIFSPGNTVDALERSAGLPGRGPVEGWEDNENSMLLKAKGKKEFPFIEEMSAFVKKGEATGLRFRPEIGSPDTFLSMVASANFGLHRVENMWVKNGEEFEVFVKFKKGSDPLHIKESLAAVRVVEKLEGFIEAKRREFMATLEGKPDREKARLLTQAVNQDFCGLLPRGGSSGGD